VQEIIKLIPNEQGSKAVSARALYDYLGYDKSQWKRWYKKNIEENPFAPQNQDWVVFDMMSSTDGGRPTKDFALSLEFAKKLAMMSRTEKGEQARNYFLECEKEAVSVKSNTTSPVQQIEAHTKRPVQVENAKGANKYSFQHGNKEACIDWNRKVAFHFTKMTPYELKEWAKKKGLPAKARTSGKEVIRQVRPDKAAGVSVADFFHAMGEDDETALKLGEMSIPLVNKLLQYNK
jgi:phage anti-repressor protein